MPRVLLSLALLAVLVVAAGCAGAPGSTTTATNSTTADATTTTSTATTTTSPSTTTSTTRPTTADYTQSIEEDLSVENDRNHTANVTIRIIGPDNETVFDRTFSLPPGDSRTFNLSFPDRDYQHGDPKYRFVASDGEHTASRSLGAPADYLVEVVLTPDGIEMRVLAA